MKNVLVVSGFLIGLVSLSFGSEARAFGPEAVRETRHDLSLSEGDAEKACTMCHINAVPGSKAATEKKTRKVIPPPLWDGNQSAISPYRTMQNLPLSEHPYNHPTGSSLVCLSCHDGALGADMHGVNVNTANLGAEAQSEWTPMSGLRGAPPLSRVDHPISIQYPRSVTGELVPQNSSVTRSRYWALPDRRSGNLTLPNHKTSSYLDLPQGKVSSSATLGRLVRTTEGIMECDSCHNPHSEAVRPFLRVPSSNLCLVCHDR